MMVGLTAGLEVIDSLAVKDGDDGANGRLEHFIYFIYLFFNFLTPLSQSGGKEKVAGLSHTCK